MEIWRAIRGWHAPLAWFAAGSSLVAVVSLVGWAVDDRTLVGQPIWTKPLKFGISLAAYAVTLAWVSSRLHRGRRVGWWAGTVLAVASTAELALIVMQVVRGRQSHFNIATDFDATVFRAMGMLVAVMYLSALVIAATLPANRIGDRALTWAVRAGAAVSMVGLSVGFLMLGSTSGQLAAVDAGAPPTLSGAHAVGVADGGPGLPLVGWSTTGGDLRVGHFVGMHALQVLPLLAAVLAARSRLDERARMRVVLVASAGYLGVVLLTVWQALRGEPLVAPDLATALAAVGVVAGTGVATAIVIRARPRAVAA